MPHVKHLGLAKGWSECWGHLPISKAGPHSSSPSCSIWSQWDDPMPGGRSSVPSHCFAPFQVRALAPWQDQDTAKTGQGGTRRLLFGSSSSYSFSFCCSASSPTPFSKQLLRQAGRLVSHLYLSVNFSQRITSPVYSKVGFWVVESQVPHLSFLAS